MFVNRLSNVVGMPESMLLGLAAEKPEFTNTHLEVQIVRYKGTNQSFELHQDSGNLFPRVFSMFIYLSTVDPGHGGETCFPFIHNEGVPGLCIRPKTGNALLWYNIREDGTPDPDLRHEGRPLAYSEGTKWGINVWWSLV